MTLFQLRRWSRLVAVLLLLGMVRLPHAALDDIACAPEGPGTYRTHDETQHGVGAAGHDQPEHCAVCHWTRTLRSPLTPAPVSSVAIAAIAAVCPVIPAVPSAVPVDRLPARAPPAA